jgi:ATP-dependent Clp protease ATP-binding subunit ClpA
MFERFTDRARRVVVLAQEEARLLNHNYIGTEHILLGLIREGDGVAAQVLARLGADMRRTRQRVIQLLPGQPVASEDLGPGEGSRPGAGFRTGAGSQPGAGDLGRWPGPALARIDALDRRLAAIERWAGLRPDLAALDRQIAQVRREKEAALERQDVEAAAETSDREAELLGARADREGQGAADVPTLAEELGRMNAELGRLRAILREHGIAPDDGTGS